MGRSSFAKYTLRGSEILARFPDMHKTSNGDSKEVLLQRQGNDSIGVGHLGNCDWYDDGGEAFVTHETMTRTIVIFLAEYAYLKG
jgi:hypothetical protein